MLLFENECKIPWDYWVNIFNLLKPAVIAVNFFLFICSAPLEYILPMKESLWNTS